MKIKKISNYIIFAISLTIIFIMAINGLTFPQILGSIAAQSKDIGIKPAILKIEGEYNNNTYNKNIFLELYGGYSKAIDVRELNGIIKLSNDFLFYPVSDITNMDKKAQAVKELKDKLDIPFVFINFPDVLSNGESYLPKGKHNSFDKQNDEILNKIRDKGIEVYDFRRYKNDTPYDYRFFKTDHHWTPGFAFDNAKEILNIIANKLNISLNPRYSDINNFEIDKYDAVFLGSAGKRVGRLYGGLDDFLLIKPKFKTDFVVNLELQKEVREGDFDKAIISKEWLYYNYYELNAYKSYFGSDRLKVSIHNKSGDVVNKKILFIIDSYSLPILSFMSCNFADLYGVDFRYVENNFSIMDYINNIKPDMVIMEYSPIGLVDDRCFNIKE